jgi:hypothetical protein
MGKRKKKKKIIPFLEHEPPPESYKKLPSFWTNSANETTFCSVFSLLLSIHNFSALASFNEWVKFAVSSVTRTQTNLRMSLYFYIPHMKAYVSNKMPLHIQVNKIKNIQMWE